MPVVDPSVIGELLDSAFVFWRLYLSLALGTLAGVAVFYIGSQDPAAAAVAFALGLAGLCWGLLWEAAHRSRK